MLEGFWCNLKLSHRDELCVQRTHTCITWSNVFAHKQKFILSILSVIHWICQYLTRFPSPAPSILPSHGAFNVKLSSSLSQWSSTPTTADHLTNEPLLVNTCECSPSLLTPATMLSYDHKSMESVKQEKQLVWIWTTCSHVVDFYPLKGQFIYYLWHPTWKLICPSFSLLYPSSLSLSLSP